MLIFPPEFTSKRVYLPIIPHNKDPRPHWAGGNWNLHRPPRCSCPRQQSSQFRKTTSQPRIWPVPSMAPSHSLQTDSTIPQLLWRSYKIRQHTKSVDSSLSVPVSLWVNHSPLWWEPWSMEQDCWQFCIKSRKVQHSAQLAADCDNFESADACLTKTILP